MSNILFNYLLRGYLKNLLKVILFFYCFGVILNLFEEIEFFKNQDTSVLTPLMLTLLYIPGMLLKLLPFIVFLSSLKFLMDIRNNRDLLSMKIFGFSNLKIFLVLATTSFVLGWLVLVLISPITSSMSKYYEKTKSNYSKDIDHLVSFNKNGLWIKENLEAGQRIISANNDKPKWLKNVKIFNFNNKFQVTEKIFAKRVYIDQNDWILNDVSVLTINNETATETKVETKIINSIYTYDKIISLYKNIDTMSFVELIMNYENLIERGYNQVFLNQNLHLMLSMPFFLFIMTALASILMMNTLKKSKNMKIIIFGLLICVLIFYLKDLSLALGQTNRIPLIAASWIPILATSIFSVIGLLQINEK
jgi:lipopolysaccharide export system permease protein